MGHPRESGRSGDAPGRGGGEGERPVLLAIVLGAGDDRGGPRATEAAEDFAGRAVEDPEHLIARVDVEQILLVAIGREVDVERRPDGPATRRSVRRRRKPRSRFDRDDPDDVPHPVEDLNPVVPAIADVQEAILAHDDAVGMATAVALELAWTRAV